MTTRNTLWEKTATVSLLNTGGTGVFTFSSVANAAGRLSDRIDCGDYPRALLWRWYFETQLQASTPVVGATIDLYAVFWDDETTPARGSGGVTGASDAAFSTENDLLGLPHIGAARVRSTSADVVTAANGLLIIPTRYFSLVAWNRSGATTTADATEHKFYLTALYPEAQNEV